MIFSEHLAGRAPLPVSPAGEKSSNEIKRHEKQRNFRQGKVAKLAELSAFPQKRFAACWQCCLSTMTVKVL